MSVVKWHVVHISWQQIKMHLSDWEVFVQLSVKSVYVAVCHIWTNNCLCNYKESIHTCIESSLLKLFFSKLLLTGWSKDQSSAEKLSQHVSKQIKLQQKSGQQHFRWSPWKMNFAWMWLVYCSNYIYVPRKMHKILGFDPSTGKPPLWAI